MAIERIVLEFSADTTKLQPAIDQLESLGEIDKKSGDSFRKTNAEIATRTKTLQTLSTEQGKVTQSTQQIATGYEKLSQSLSKTTDKILDGASGEMVEQFALGISDALNEAGISAEQFSDKMQEAFQKGSSGNDNGAVKQFTSLKSELRALKAELAGLDPNSARFKELSVQAGELEDRIGDVNLQVRNLASDTAQLDGAIQAIQGVAGAFQLAQGSAALFGDESEDVQKTLVKMTALLNITNGLQQIQTILQRQSAASLLVVNLQQKALVASKALEGAVESKNIIVRTAAIATQKALNAAQAASPTGLLAVALAGLAVALFAYAKEAETAEEKQVRLNQAQLDALELNNQLNDLYQSNSDKFIADKEKEIAVLRAQGATSVVLAEKELELANLKNRQVATSIGFSSVQISQIGELTAQYGDLLHELDRLKSAGADAENNQRKLVESQIELVGAQLDQAKKLRDNQNASRKELAIAEANLIKARQDAAKKAADDAEAIRKRNREIALQRLNDEKAVIETTLVEVKKGTEEELSLREALIQKQAQIDLFSLEGTKNTEAQRNLIIAKANEAAKALRTDNERKIIEAIFTEQEKLNQIDQNDVDARLNQVTKNTEEELQLKLSAIEIEADSQKLAAQKKFELSSKTVTDEKLFQSEIVAADQKAAADRMAAFKEMADFKKATAEETAQLEIELQKQLTDAAFSAADQVSGYIADSGKQRRDAQLSADLDAIEAQKNKELSNKRLTEDQKAKIDEKYRKQEAAIKLQAWEANQRAAISQAEINGLLAITQILADPTVLAPFKPVAIAAAILTTALQIGKISSQEPPKFTKGVERLQGSGSETSDSILAKLSKGERVVPSDVNRDYFPALHVIHKRKIPPAIANELLSPKKRLTLAKSVTAKESSFEIDYKKMAGAISDELYDPLSEVAENTNKMVQAMAQHNQTSSFTIANRYR
jgi:hypothetical protein